MAQVTAHATEQLDEASPDSEAAGPRIRDEHFWFEDGNLILLARSVEFRVYRGLLMKHSPVFRDILSIPIADGDLKDNSVQSLTRDAEGVPILVLSDSPEALRHLLHIVGMGGDLHFRLRDDGLAIHQISAVVRLGHKYQLDGLVEQALEQLKARYPSELTEWIDAFPRNAHIAPRHSILAINLARLTGTTSVLPAALLGCCTLDIDQLLAGVDSGALERLSDADFRLVLVARTDLIHAHNAALFRVLGQLAGARCTAPADCSKTQLKAYAAFGPRWVAGAMDLHARFTTNWLDVRVENAAPIRSMLCAVCEERMGRDLAGHRQQLWDVVVELLWR